MKRKFRTLMYGANYVDVNRLTGDGGYITDTPHLFPENYTKEDLINEYSELAEAATYVSIAKAQIENLKKNLEDCRMVDIELIIV
jgi:hypothetical protein